MKRYLARTGIIALALGAVAAAAIVPALASSGVGEPAIEVVGERAVSAFGNFNGTVNGDGSSTIVYECGGTATPDAASTSVVRCLIRVNGAGYGNTTCALPADAVACLPQIRTVPRGFTQLCYQAKGDFIDGVTTIYSPKNGEKCSTVNLQY